MSFSEPRTLVQELALQEGMRVADFGAGSGHYTLAAARKVGSSGRVCAIDIQKNLLTRIKDDAVREGISNVEIIWGDLDEKGGSKLSPDSMDAVIVANVLFQIEHRNTVVEEIARVLKPRGRVLLVDWEDSFGGIGPKSEDLLRPNRAKELFEEGGFVTEKDVSAHAGDHHYGYIFSKQ